MDNNGTLGIMVSDFPYRLYGGGKQEQKGLAIPH